MFAKTKFYGESHNLILDLKMNVINLILQFIYSSMFIIQAHGEQYKIVY